MEHDKNKAINAIKYNIRVLNSVVLLIVSILFFLNIKFIYEALDYIPSLSIASMITIISLLVLINLYLSRIISRNAIREIEEYDNKLNIALSDLQEEVRERKKIEEKLEYKALHDSLTNIPNRTQFTEFMSRVITRPTRHDNYMFAVLFLDLDRFKIINDGLGHVMGDQLLIDVAQRLKKCTRPVDKFARFGGDEFIIFLDDIADVGDATYVADRIQNELLHPFKLGEREVFITVSIGIALSSKDYNSVNEIIRDADVAMYRAKALGRARYEIFDSKLHKSAMKLFELEADLRRAVDKKEFIVHYQPIILVSNGNIVGTEALIRWKHPVRGMIPPKEFIPLAEETGLISEIGEWMINESCTQNKIWQDSGHHLLIDVNLSSRQFQNQDLLKTISKVLRDTGLPAQLLNIEITESIAMEPRSIEILNKLTDMGISTSVDDFGTGYSSLGSLKRFPISALKIDKSFVKDITIDSDIEAIVKAIIAMAHTLNIKVIAEGVETEEQLRFLHSHGCDEIQGYLCNPPIPPEELTELLEKWDNHLYCNLYSKEKLTRVN